MIWVVLLFHVSIYTARSHEFCTSGFCINLSRTDIVSEMGLCVVIPCSFSASDFTPQSVVWFKCPQSKNRCSDSEIIFHSKNSDKVLDGFQGRVRMLETDVTRKDCSIIVNDLTPSDSGAYQMRVNGLLANKTTGFMFKNRVFVNVMTLWQKPTVLSPTAVAGQASTFTCMAPGLCSGYVPTISWAWRRAGDNDSHAIVNNLTISRYTFSPTALRYKSTWTFNATAEHHGRDVTCKVSYYGVNVTTEKTVKLYVTYEKPPSIFGRTTLKEGDTLTLFCKGQSFPPSRVMWNLPSINATNVPRRSPLNPTASNASLVIPNVTTGHSGRYECVATQHTAHVDVMVTWFAGILDGSGCLLRGQMLTCVCISGGVPPPAITFLLANRTVCSAVAAKSNDRVNGSVTLIAGDLNNISAVECVSTHKDGEDRKALNVRITEQEGMKKIVTMLRPDIFIAFLSGALLSAILCWLSWTCCSKAKKSPGRSDLELLAPQEDPQEHDIKDVGEAATKADVDYASINFSALRRNKTREAATNHQATEYAEIKTKGDGGQSVEHDDDKGKEEITVEDKTQGNNDEEEKEEEEEALYSNVKEAMMS
ncbi:sialic acid-binding Ig-like lectin 5 isoform X2 [Vanacampus margaritifer]